MRNLIIESHYLGSLEFYTLLQQAESIEINKTEIFKKQTYRNRCYISSANGVLKLVVPVNYSSLSRTEEVTIAQGQRWKKDHWGAIYSAYGKAPFFDYFSEYFYSVIFKNHKYLIDLNQELLHLTLKLLQLNVKVAYSGKENTADFVKMNDLLSPKKSFVDRKIYDPVQYSQLFGSEFSPNMSVIDLLMCEGPRSRQILSASFLSQENHS